MEQKKRTFNVLFLMRRNKQSDAEASLFCRITIRGQRYEFPLNCKIRARNWNAAAQKSTGKTEVDRDANTRIEDIKLLIDETVRKLHDKGHELTVQNFRLTYQARENEYDTIRRLFDYHEIIDRKNLREGSYRGYIVTKKHLLDYVRIKYHLSDYKITAIDKPFVQEFFAYLQGYRREGNIRCAVNGALKHITRFKRVMNLALQNEWIDRNPVCLLKVKKTKVEKGFLTESEIKKLEEVILKPHLAVARDIFMFSVYTGIAYVDVSKMTLENIVQGIDKSLWLQFNRQKTDIRVALPLLEPANRLIERYHSYHEGEKAHHLFPVPMNQVINRYLKEIASIAGINKVITFHMARHTFATTITLMHGIPIETVSKMLGHASLSTTQIYAKVIDNKVMDDMAALKEMYAKKESQKSPDNKAANE